MLSVKPINFVKAFTISSLLMLGVANCIQQTKANLSEEEKEYNEALHNYQNDSAKYQKAYNSYTLAEMNYSIASINYERKKQEAYETGEGVMLRDIKDFEKYERQFNRTKKWQPQLNTLYIQKEKSKQILEQKKEQLDIAMHQEEIYKANHEEI